MKFQKIHSLGNDFVIFGNPYQNRLPSKEFISRLCDRHFGIGCDFAVFISNSSTADYFMHVFSPDGFEIEFCGNALRCSAKYVSDNGYFKKRCFTVETNIGTRSVITNIDDITTEIGKSAVIQKGNLIISSVSLPYYYVSLGDPHCVIFLTYGLDDKELNHFGFAIENHPNFPNGTNVDFVCVSDNNRMVARIWARGIGEILSSSNGSCACVTAAQQEGLCGNHVQVYQPGGVITVETRCCGNMFITGKCTPVFKGTYLQ